MRYFVVICCVLASVAAKDKKISLEDIENDSLKAKQSPRTVSQKTGSPTNYGFLPTKTVTDYARQQPKYVQYVPPQQYTTSPQQYQQIFYQQQPAVNQASLYQQQHLNQANLYQQYANLQYVTDNSIAQTQQQYYTPQYVYYQQYTAPSTAVQSVVDPKGGIQYVMYVPTYVSKAEQTQNVENVVYTTGEQQSYVVPQAEPQVTPAIKYVPEAPKAQEQPQYYIKQQQPQYYTKQEPKSLLDSYVPSLLQVQYYKQQQAQAQANAIQQSLKEVSSVSGKGSYRPATTQHNSAESTINYTYQIPSTQEKYN